MPQPPVCEHAGVIRRLRTSLMLANDLDLDALRAQYGGLHSKEHDGVQTLIALARELRVIEHALRPRRNGRTRAR